MRFSVDHHDSPGEMFACTRAGLCAVWLLSSTLASAQTQTASVDAAATAIVPAALALANSTAASLAPAELHDLLPQHRLSGKSRLAVWGLDVYDASLWVAPGFRADKLTAHPFALELVYLRNFSNTDIAARSMAEMRRLAPVSEAQAGLWMAAMLGVIPNVKKGDRITGVYRPGTGTTFLVNGKPAGNIQDAEFARLFFSIWLSPQTSKPQVRRALLAGSP